MLVSITLAALLVLRHEAAIRVVGAEAYKILLQFLLVAVLGGAVSLFYQAFNRDADARLHRVHRAEERAAAVREARQNQLREVVAQYNAVKRSRRLLRAQAQVRRPADADARLLVAKYDELMRIVLDAQLSLETVSHVVGADDKLFPNRDDLTASLGAAESYLRYLVREYEAVLPTVAPDEELADLARLPILTDFIGPYGASVDFRTRFVHPLRHVLSEIQHLVLTPPPPVTD